jgi:hypothetical protein
MSKRKDKGRIEGQFVPLRHEILDSRAWRAMSNGARVLYIALRRRMIKNNGRVYLSTRDAAAELGSNRDAVQRWFRELQHYGFIVMTSGGCLGVDGKGKAPHWRLTELPTHSQQYNSLDPGTKDYLSWKGKKFRGQKKQNPGREIGASVDAKAGPYRRIWVAPISRPYLVNHLGWPWAGFV